MFDWIGDAIDWIGEGIFSQWENTVGLVTGDVASVLFEMMFDWIFMLIYNGIAEIFYLIDQSTADLFELNWIQAFISLFHNISWILFITGLVVAVFDTAIAYENGQANIKDTTLNVLKGFFACSLITIVPQRLYSFCISLQHTFATDLISVMLQNKNTTLTGAALEALETFNTDVSLSSLFFIILFGYCTIKVVFANIKRGGILLCQIAVGSLYMFSVPRGYTDGFVSWCKQVIATCLTAFLQTTILFLGLLTCPDHPILAAGICLSANEVPRIAQMYGLDTSTKVNVMAVGHAVNMGSRAVGLIKSVSKVAT